MAAVEKQLDRAGLMGREMVRKNLRALEVGGQHQTLTWLMEAPALKTVAEVIEADGRSSLKVSGQSQASRRDPEGEAARWLNQSDFSQGPAVLFGLGSPWPAALLLARGPLMVYEPDPLVLLAALSQYDFSEALAKGEGGLTILNPWLLASGRLAGAGRLLAHPSARRRQSAQANHLQRALKGEERSLAGRSGRLKIMVAPPLSGGSWPVAASLARAAESAGHEVSFIHWPPDLLAQERRAQEAAGAEGARLAAELFSAAAPMIIKEAESFGPDVVIALAQAPLDESGLESLRAACPAPLAFWLVEDLNCFGYVAEVAPAYDVIFHIQKGLIEPMLKNWGLGRAFYLPLAADPELFRPRPPEETRGYRAELSFMGAGYANRRYLLGRLAGEYWPSSGRPARGFRVFGSGWDGVGPPLSDHLFEGGRRVSAPECALIYAGGLINLNIHSSRRAEAAFDPAAAFVNPRTFEIAAAGAFQIVDQRPLLAELFQPGQEMAVAENPEDLPGLIDHYLTRPEEAAAIGRAGRERVLAEHTYEHRLKEILGSLGWLEEN